MAKPKSPQRGARLTREEADELEWVMRREERERLDALLAFRAADMPGVAPEARQIVHLALDDAIRLYEVVAPVLRDRSKRLSRREPAGAAVREHIEAKLGKPLGNRDRLVERSLACVNYLINLKLACGAEGRSIREQTKADRIRAVNTVAAGEGIDPGDLIEDLELMRARMKKLGLVPADLAGDPPLRDLLAGFTIQDFVIPSRATLDRRPSDS